MIDRISNVHMHIFVSECAPPGFLKVVPAKLVKPIAKPVKWLLESPDMRRRIWRWNKLMPLLSRLRRVRLDRVIAFLNVSAQLTQKDVFEISLKTAKTFGTNPRIIAHTLDMEHMDTSSKPIIPYETQVLKVMQIKRFYPDTLFPFVCADPRTRSGNDLVEWVDYYFTHGVISPSQNKAVPLGAGIKIYPAHGFFPFDPKLEALYKYAEEHEIPIMYHCTREGSQYIGNAIESLIQPRPNIIMPDENDKDAYNRALIARNEIFGRIGRYYAKGNWIKNSNLGINEFACDLFSHPQNYVPILCRFPKLKICLAHMGGASEVEYMYPENKLPKKPNRELKELIEIWETDGYNWAMLIKEMMKEFPNFYTDISSTITHLDDDPVLKNIQRWLEEVDNHAQPLGNRMLFGTDYFLTEQSHSETELYEFMETSLGDWFQRMAGENIDNYLKLNLK